MIQIPVTIIKPSEKHIYTMTVDRAQRIKEWDGEALKGHVVAEEAIR
jgi:hypothetical protein